MSYYIQGDSPGQFHPAMAWQQQFIAQNMDLGGLLGAMGGPQGTRMGKIKRARPGRNDKYTIVVVSNKDQVANPDLDPIFRDVMDGDYIWNLSTGVLRKIYDSDDLAQEIASLQEHLAHHISINVPCYPLIRKRGDHLGGGHRVTRRTSKNSRTSRNSRNNRNSRTRRTRRTSRTSRNKNY